MQVPANPDDAAALAAALQPGQDRVFSHLLEADWNRDGAYNHALSNLSRAVETARVSRELVDNTPGSEVVTSGAAAAEFAATLGGDLSSTPVSEVFAPYNTASPLYGKTIPGTPLRWSITTATSRGPITVRQFTGTVDECRVSRRDNTVVLTGLDAVATTLAQPAFWPMWAVDGGAAGRKGTTEPQRGLASSVVDLGCNKTGLLTRPRPPWDSHTGVTCLAEVPLHGSFAPARGRVRSKDPWGVATGSLFVESFTTSPDPAPDRAYWVAGQWGLARNADPGRHPGTMHYIGSDDQPRYSGRSTSITAWIWCGPGAPGYDANPSATLRPPVASVYFGSANVGGSEYAHRLGIASNGKVLQIQVETGTTLIYRVNHTPGTDAWRHVHVQYDHNTGSPVRAKMIVDGVTQADFVPTGASNSESATPISTTYPPSVGPSIQPGVRMSDVLWWQETGAPTVVPERTITGGAKAVIQPSLNQLTHQPTPTGSWRDVVRDLTAAEYGTVLVDELGVLRWHNRDTVRSAAEPLFTVDLKHAADVGGTVTGTAIANGIRVTSQSGSGTWRQGWELPAVDEFVVPPGVHGKLFPLDGDVISPESATNPAMYRTSGTAPPPVWSSKVAHGWVFCYDGGETQELSNSTMVRTDDQANLGDQQLIRVIATNTSTTAGRFRLQKDATAGTDPQPALRVAGLVLVKDPAATTDVRSEENITADGPVAIELTPGDWHQDPESVQATAAWALRRTTQHIPTLDALDTPGDPRRQLTDPCLLTLGPSASRVRAYVAGIVRSLDTREGCRDVLTIRPTHAPGRWALGDTTLGKLETTAVLG